MEEMKEYNETPVSETRLRLILLHFLHLFKRCRELNIIKRNGMFPVMDNRSDSRKGYNIFFTKVLRKYIEYIFPGTTIQKARDMYTYKIMPKDGKYTFGSNTYFDSLCVSEVHRNALGDTHHPGYITRDSHSLMVSEERGRPLVQYDFRDRESMKETVVAFFEKVEEELSAWMETLGRPFIGIERSPKALEKALDKHKYLFKNIAGKVDNEAGESKSDLFKMKNKAFIDKFLEVKNSSRGLPDQDVFRLTKVFFPHNEDTQNLKLVDFVSLAGLDVEV